MHDSKVCFKCGIEKPLTDFYKHSMMADKHVNKCKECTKKDVSANYAKNRDYFAEYERTRASLPHRVEARLKYSHTEEGKEACRRAKQKWTETNVIKRAASHIVGNAVRDGKLVKQYVCEHCGKDKVRIHGHHDDYAFPLSVRWLCSKCHTAWHKENGSGRNG